MSKGCHTSLTVIAVQEHLFDKNDRIQLNFNFNLFEAVMEILQTCNRVVARYKQEKNLEWDVIKIL